MKHIHAKIACAVLGAAFAVGIGTSLTCGESPEIASPSPSLRKAIETRASSVTAEQSTFTATISNNIGGDTNVSYKCAQGGGTVAPAINNGQIRLYQKNSKGDDGGQITINVADGYKITSLTIGSGMNTTVRYLVNGEDEDGLSGISISKNGTYTVNSANHSGIDISSVTIICNGTSSSTRLYVNYLSVTYEPLVDTPSDAVLSSIALEQGTAPTEVYQNAEVDISGYLLTGIYTSPSTPDFSSELAISTNDENVTWNYDTSELGNAEISATYNDGAVNLTSNSLPLNVVADPLAGTVADTLVATDFKATSNSYIDFSNVTKDTGTVYAGSTATTYGAIQLRSKPDDETGTYSGIVMTSSVSKAVAIELTFNSNTYSARVVSVYGQSTAYSSADDLYGGASPIAEIAYSDGANQLIVFDQPYDYIGIRSESNALYLDEVTFYFEEPEPSQAESYAEMFIEFMTCDGKGAITAAQGTWETLSERYANLSDSDKRILKEATPDENSESLIEQAVARYDYIVGKYGVEQYPDFMGRTPARIAEARSVDVNDQTATWVIAGISAAGIASAAAFFFLRRRKEA